MGKNKRIIKDSSALGQFSSAIAQICEEKGIDKDRVIESVEAALAAAYKKDYGKKGQIIIAELDEKNGEVVFKQLCEVVDESVRTIEEEYMPEGVHEIPKNAVKSKEVIDRSRDHSIEEGVALPKFNHERDVLLEDAQKVDETIKAGEFLEIPLETKNQYGRVASQTAKQVIIQRIREAERDSMYDEYKGKEGEIINGIVQRIEMNKVYIDLGKTVGTLFPSEQIPNEQYRIGQRFKVYIEKVESDPKGPGITLSRRHPNLLLKLFELEVPEIFAGTVDIKAVVREAGARSKVAVISNEEGIDPIGSCVGQRGTRVQAVIDEMNGEKIDIIEWSDDVEKFIANALSPAKVVKIDVKEDSKEAAAYVVKDQLSLAIGKKGQNVRLAAKLTGWRIDVKTIEDDEAASKKEDDEKGEGISKDNNKKKEEDKDKGQGKSAEETQEEEQEKETEKKSVKKGKTKEKKEKKDKKQVEKTNKRLKKEKKEESSKREIRKKDRKRKSKKEENEEKSK
ncbi:MAG: transcription termination factor NusA [Patescibacteria group bacterium]|nr:transcription termination factor NusA [Patescibacteria group bacterium]